MKVYHLFLFTFLFFTCLILFTFYGFYFLLLRGGTSDQNNENVEQEIFQYRYFEKDYERKVTSRGIVSLLEELNDNGFRSHDDHELQKSYLISSFETEEYECFGGCVCENGEHRRNTQSSRVLIEGVSYLLAAVSSVIALDIAEDYFSGKCTEEFSTKCESESINSIVTHCESTTSSETNEGSKSYSKQQNTMIEEVEKRVYFCYGNCLDSLKFGGMNSKNYRPKAKEILGEDCTKLKQEGEVTVYSNELSMKSELKPMSVKMRETARKKFSEHYLVNFCRDRSLVEYEYTQVLYNRLKSGERKKSEIISKREGRMCVGVRMNSISHVRCIQIHPETQSPNRKWRHRVWWEDKREWDEM